MRKAIVLCSALAIIFFITSFLLYPIFLDRLLGMFEFEFGHYTQVVSNGISDQYSLVIKSSIAFACIPLTALLLFILIKQTKNHKYSPYKLFFIIPILLVTFIIGCCLKLITLAELASTKPASGIKNNISIDSLYFYDYGFVGVIFSAFLVYLLTRKRKFSEKEIDLLDESL